jgi:hypothetical protein
MTQKDGRDLRYINLAIAHVKTLMLAAVAYHPAISLEYQAPGHYFFSGPSSRPHSPANLPLFHLLFRLAPFILPGQIFVFSVT